MNPHSVSKANRGLFCFRLAGAVTLIGAVAAMALVVASPSSAAAPKYDINTLAGIRVEHQDVLDRIVEHCVVRGKDCSTRISEDCCDTLVDEAFPDDLRTRSLRGHEPSVHCRRTSVKLIVVPTK